jgi:copper chaperone
MTTSIFTVNGMTCGHCVAAVTQEVSKLDHVTGVDIDLGTGSVTVHGDGPIDPVAFAAAVDEAGYEVAPGAVA